MLSESTPDTISITFVGFCAGGSAPEGARLARITPSSWGPACCRRASGRACAWSTSDSGGARHQRMSLSWPRAWAGGSRGERCGAHVLVMSPNW
eukprot:3071301-Prymnesium_polylepis.1